MWLEIYYANNNNGPNFSGTVLQCTAFNYGCAVCLVDKL